MAKLNCTNPAHVDSTPSMEAYNDGAWCFSCGWLDRSLADEDAPPRETEDLQVTIQYIKGLQSKVIRGLSLPYDNTGFYILWPDGKFYKKRLFDGKTRYIAPKGHQAPLFAYPAEGKSIILIEGELNCMSIKVSLPDLSVTLASPGPSTEFYRQINNLLYYDKFVIVVDRDASGVAAGIEAKQELLKRGKRVELIAVSQDYNEVLQQKGKSGVREQFKKDLGL